MGIVDKRGASFAVINAQPAMFGAAVFVLRLGGGGRGRPIALVPRYFSAVYWHTGVQKRPVQEQLLELHSKLLAQPEPAPFLLWQVLAPKKTMLQYCPELQSL